MIRGIRGATTAASNKEQEVLLATKQLLDEMILHNRIMPEKIASVFISATNDIGSVFPAKALRQLEGWTFVPVMCMQELDVEGGLPLCIRVMIHYNTEEPQEGIKHIYKNEAIRLRPDLGTKGR